MKLPFPSCPFITLFTAETGPCRFSASPLRLQTGDSAQLIYHESIEVAYRIGEVELKAARGSVLFLPPHVQAEAHPPAEGTVIRIGYHSEQAAIGPSSPMLLSTYAPRLLRERFLHFAAAVASGTEGREIAMLAHFYGILYDLNRNTAEGNRRTLQFERIRPSVVYLEHHDCERGLNMKQVAALSGISDTQLRTLFARLYGCTPLEYVTERRVARAERLLRETALPLSEIREACGFRDAAHFRRVFQKLRGCTPESLRES